MTPILASGFVPEMIEFMAIAVVLFPIVIWISKLLPNARDREWLPHLVIWGFFAKMMGSFLRYFMAADIYGTSDSFRYHAKGIAYASIWRHLSVPVSNSGGEGTGFTEVVTGLIYAVYTPAMRGGFLMFAFIAFVGQLLYYAAFRPWLPDSALKRFAFVMLFFPSIVFWPASVGKDALMMFFTGLATLGISRLLRRIELTGLVLAGLGLYLTAEIRPHIALMLAMAAVLAFVLMRRNEVAVSGFKRVIPIAAAVIGLVFAWSAFATDFEVSLEGTVDTQDPAAFLTRVEDQTSQGGSQVTGGVVRGPQDLPAATLKVLFRPLIYEGTSPAILLSSLEGTALLLVVVWKLPMVWRNRRMIRPNPLLLLSFIYTGGFIIAFSSILNLGILARQRVQVLPFFLALLVTLGWPPEDADAPKRHGRAKRQVVPAAVTPEGMSALPTATGEGEWQPERWR